MQEAASAKLHICSPVQIGHLAMVEGAYLCRPIGQVPLWNELLQNTVNVDPMVLLLLVHDSWQHVLCQLRFEVSKAADAQAVSSII